MVTSLIAELMNSQPPLVLLDSSMENFTSAEVIGWPLWNLTSFLSFRVHDLLSGDIS